MSTISDVKPMPGRVVYLIAVACLIAFIGQAAPAHAQETLDDLDKDKDKVQGGAQTKHEPRAPLPARINDSRTPVVGRLRTKPSYLVGRRRRVNGKEVAEPTESSGKRPLAEVTGYLDNRFQYGYVNPNASPISTIDVPSIQEILEANIQLKLNLGTKAFVYGDVSLVYQNGWLFYDRDGEDGRVTYPDHDVDSLHPFVTPSELYFSYSLKPWFNILLGKKRIVWGSGFAFNPTDLINPPKDPTDPNFQRAGYWLARFELPFEKFTISTLFSPQVLYQSSGIPYALMKYPDCSVPSCTAPPDDSYHYLLSARLYMLIYSMDINLFYFFSNKYNDSFENTSRFGASLSRYFLTDYEFHIESLFQVGSARQYPNLQCTPGSSCSTSTPLSASKLHDGIIYPHLLIGGRTQFKDDSTISIEYYYQADGYSDREFGDFLRILTKTRQMNMPATGTSMAPAGGSSGSLPQRFTFDPLRRHYLIASFSKPKIKDDWTIGTVLIAGLTDLSGTISPSVTWNTREWLNLSLYGFIPIRGIPLGQVTVNDKNYSEYSLVPIDFRVLFEARAFY